MTATRQDISRWLDALYERPDCTHMLVMCDQFDYEDYPVYVKKGQDPKEVRDAALNELVGFHECYTKSISKEIQLAEYRVVHFD